MDTQQNGHLNTPLAMEEVTLDLIKKRIRSLCKKRKRILQMEKLLGEGKPLDKQQREALQSKPSLLARIDLLDKLSKEIYSALNNSCKQLPLNPGPINRSVPDESEVAAGAQFITFGSFQVPVRDIINPKKQAAPFKAVKNQDRSNTNDKLRYLCISDGLCVYCLDLKQNKYESNGNSEELPPLPKLSTLNLAEKGLPILSGLFKLGSNAYMIGGRQFAALKNEPHDWFTDIFRSFSKKSGLDGTSRVTYRLSLADGQLSLSECSHIKPLNYPVCWPIVEKIGDQIHVIESFPVDLFSFIRTRRANHEFLDLNNLNGGWANIEHMIFECMSMCSGVRMWAHLVVGDRMYTKAEAFNTERTLILESNHEWDVEQEMSLRKRDELFLVDHVTQIFKFGRGIRCVGEFLHDEIISSKSLYVVFAIVVDRGCVFAVAYLVDCIGHVICFQEVPHFFDGVTRPGSAIEESIVIKVDDEEKTMCAIIRGKPRDGCASECLFVYTFTVEEAFDARLRIRDFWKIRANGGAEAADMQDFVRVDVKGRYVYRMDAQRGSHGTRMQACFL